MSVILTNMNIIMEYMCKIYPKLKGKVKKSSKFSSRKCAQNVILHSTVMTSRCIQPYSLMTLLELTMVPHIASKYSKYKHRARVKIRPGIPDNKVWRLPMFSGIARILINRVVTLRAQVVVTYLVGSPTIACGHI